MFMKLPVGYAGIIFHFENLSRRMRNTTATGRFAVVIDITLAAAVATVVRAKYRPEVGAVDVLSGKKKC